jgi:DNA polymerase II small subunit/DNA polymerase delta subunit B
MLVGMLYVIPLAQRHMYGHTYHMTCRVVEIVAQNPVTAVISFQEFSLKGPEIVLRPTVAIVDVIRELCF